MTWCVVKHEEALGPPCVCLENVDGMINLLLEFVGTKVTLSIFSGLE